MDNSSKVEVDYKQNSHHEETVMMKSPKTYEEQGEIIRGKDLSWMMMKRVNLF